MSRAEDDAKRRDAEREITDDLQRTAAELIEKARQMQQQAQLLREKAKQLRDHIAKRK